MPEEFKERIHRLARCNKADWSIVFTDRDNEPIDEDNNVNYDPNNNPTPEDDIFNLDYYVPNNFLVGVNGGNDAYENTYEKHNVGNANYYASLEEDK